MHRHTRIKSKYRKKLCFFKIKAYNAALLICLLFSILNLSVMNMRKSENTNNSSSSGSDLDSDHQEGGKNAQQRPEGPMHVMNAVVHVGPHKTGTTTIQTLSLNIVDHLSQDNYEMPWYRIYNQTNDKNDKMVNQVQFCTCFFSETNEEFRMNSIYADTKRAGHTFPRGPLNKKAWPCRRDFFHAGQEIADEQKSLLISAETFDMLNSDDIQTLSQYLAPWQNVTIVITYRRFYQWLTSYHNQLSKGNGFKFFQANETDRHRLSLVDALSDPEWMEIISRRHTFSVARRYEKYFEHVEVINIHDMKKMKGRDLAEVFYCDFIPHAPNTCQEVERIMQKNERKANKSVPLVYEDIVYAAHHRGIIDIQSKEQMKMVIKEIRDHQEKTLNKSSGDFKLRCPSTSVLDDILQRSVEAERELVPEFFATDNGEVELKRDFEVYSKTSLCDVDIAATLESSEWGGFFQSLAQMMHDSA